MIEYKINESVLFLINSWLTDVFINYLTTLHSAFYFTFSKVDMWKNLALVTLRNRKYSLAFYFFGQKRNILIGPVAVSVKISSNPLKFILFRWKQIP